MIYQPGQFYTFTVRPGLPSDELFTIEVQGPDGPATTTLPKLAFQRNPKRPHPRTLECRVKEYDENGLPVLAHAISTYVSELYSDMYARGESFGCTVVNVPTNPKAEPYYVRDDNGIYFRVSELVDVLAKDQRIRCKFKILSGKRFEVIRVNDVSKLPYFSPEELFEGAALRSDMRKVFHAMLLSSDFETVRAEIENRNPRWPLSASTIITDRLSTWFVEAHKTGRRQIVKSVLASIEQLVLFLLEGSNYLTATTYDQRRPLQEQLTRMVDNLVQFQRARRLLEDNSEDDFVEGLFDKLKKSGYLYHPGEQFGVLMLIFRVYPEKVSSYLNRIFESIFSRELENWNREPFGPAFVEQFQIYVRQTRSDIDSLPLAESQEQKARLETVITALALQIILSGDDDHELARSLYYRYISLLRPTKTDDLLTKAFISLMGAAEFERLEYRQLREPNMMMTKATIMPEGDVFSRIKGTPRFSNGLVDINISSEGISLSRAADRRQRKQGIIERGIADGVMSWLHPQIYVGGIKPLSRTKTRLADHNNWWKQVESAMFQTAPEQTETTELRNAVVGEEVWIAIDSVSDPYDNDPTFNCHIQHEGIVEAKGYVKRSSIVNYNLKMPSQESYKAPDGSSLGFFAKVTGITNGIYQFNLVDQVNNYIQSVLNFSDEYLAVVTGTNPQGYSGISNDGIGLYLRDDSETKRNLKPGTIVRFRLHSGSTQGNIIGYITGESYDSNDQFDKTRAFAKLMNAIGEVDAGEPDNAESDDDMVSDDVLEFISADKVREIIEILRFGAIGSRELLKAYDYLRYARLMALAIDDTALASKLETHAALLVQHQYYATNRRVDAEALERLRDLSRNDPMLRMIFHRLEMVSWLGKPENNHRLYATADSPSNELEGSIARMVLSYNMLEEDDAESDSGIAATLKEKIMEKLNVNSETKRGKYYGTESKYVEFKTSLVFPATGPGEEMREAQGEQLNHIMSRIAGMLNASGGQLYIGVNNDGYAVGLREDFKYWERHKARFENITSSVPNIDTLCVFLENVVNKVFEPTVARKITIGRDPDSEKDVVAVSINESLEPVFIDNRLFVRQSGQATREYHGKDIDDFVEERRIQRLERTHAEALLAAEANALQQHGQQQSEQPLAAEQPTDAPQETHNSAAAEEKNANANRIATSAWRPNVLHSFEDGYTEPEGYLYFIDDNKMMFSSIDTYKDNEPSTLLSLVIPHEQRDAFLVLGFEDRRALKIPLAEIYERGDNSIFSYSADYRLLFATIADKDDILVQLLADNSDSLWRRAHPLAQIDQSHIGSLPKRLFELPAANTFAWELAQAGTKANFSGCINEKMKSKQLGETLRVKINDDRLQSKLDELIGNCHNSSI